MTKTKPASSQRGRLEPVTATLQVRCADHSATPPLLYNTWLYYHYQLSLPTPPPPTLPYPPSLKNPLPKFSIDYNYRCTCSFNTLILNLPAEGLQSLLGRTHPGKKITSMVILNCAQDYQQYIFCLETTFINANHVFLRFCSSFLLILIENASCCLQNA